MEDSELQQKRAKSGGFDPEDHSHRRFNPLLDEWYSLLTSVDLPPSLSLCPSASLSLCSSIEAFLIVLMPLHVVLIFTRATIAFVFVLGLWVF